MIIILTTVLLFSIINQRLREFKSFDLDYIKAVILIWEGGGGVTYSREALNWAWHLIK